MVCRSIDWRANLWIDGPSFTEHLHITASGEIPFRKSFTLPPGRHAITFRSDGKKLDAPMDPRSIVFRVHNFQVFWMEPGNDPPSYSPGLAEKIDLPAAAPRLAALRTRLRMKSGVAQDQAAFLDPRNSR